VIIDRVSPDGALLAGAVVSRSPPSSSAPPATASTGPPVGPGPPTNQTPDDLDASVLGPPHPTSDECAPHRRVGGLDQGGERDLPDAQMRGFRVHRYRQGALVVVLDCADLDRAAAFWTTVLDYRREGYGGGS